MINISNLMSKENSHIIFDFKKIKNSSESIALSQINEFAGKVACLTSFRLFDRMFFGGSEVFQGSQMSLTEIMIKTARIEIPLFLVVQELMLKQAPKCIVKRLFPGKEDLLDTKIARVSRVAMVSLSYFFAYKLGIFEVPISSLLSIGINSVLVEDAGIGPFLVSSIFGRLIGEVQSRDWSWESFSDF